ncbi:WhiB family transcriptional regulator [Nonomuraea sp. NN258]|uniref:WhiB family transcriptional regulator n=1 Tax=Nonomuraea antri TaxID=2730852 RepID=UPI001568E8F5|nr:WhiB family transcriptional regulator [Nonomuraea antri]NRQ32988.1 WhiB family transcriptional regulator [Nonomuraea antri]
MTKRNAARLSDRQLSDLRDEVLNSDPACETGDAELFTGPDLFEEEPEDERQAREDRAKAVCATCPAQTACLTYALAVRPQTGIWAGLTAAELRAVRRRASRRGAA